MYSNVAIKVYISKQLCTITVTKVVLLMFVIYTKPIWLYLNEF